MIFMKKYSHSTSVAHKQLECENRINMISINHGGFYIKYGGDKVCRIKNSLFKGKSTKDAQR